MLISFLMTLASFMGLFMIHYHNTTVYQPQLLLAAPKALPLLQEPLAKPNVEFYTLPQEEFCLEPFLIEDDDEIDIDDSSYDDYVEELVPVANVQIQTEGVSPILASLPFLFISTYVVLLLCVQRQILDGNKKTVVRPRNVITVKYIS